MRCRGMNFKRYDPDVWIRGYIRPPLRRNKYYIKMAAVLSGIAAIFVSTRNRVLPVITNFFYSIFVLLRTVSIFEPCVFLFVQVTDKPSIRPRCRSPPPLLSFWNFEERRETHALPKHGLYGMDGGYRRATEILHQIPFSSRRTWYYSQII